MARDVCQENIYERKSKVSDFIIAICCVWLIPLSISIDICYLNLLSLCFSMMFYTSSLSESPRDRQNEESSLFFFNISFHHVSIGKTASKMDSLRSAVIRTIYYEKWCVSRSNKLINSFKEKKFQIYSCLTYNLIIPVCVNLQWSLMAFSLLRWSFGIVLYEIFTIGMSDNCVSVYFIQMAHFLIDLLSSCLISRLRWLSLSKDWRKKNGRFTDSGLQDA